MLRLGNTPQIARSVLPNCLKTEIVMTANLREFRHFITLRGAKAAHPQIRPVAVRMHEILMAHALSVFEDLTPEL
jgi:thymidylate synthase (FAD)